MPFGRIPCTYRFKRFDVYQIYIIFANFVFNALISSLSFRYVNNCENDIFFNVFPSPTINVSFSAGVAFEVSADINTVFNDSAI